MADPLTVPPPAPAPNLDDLDGFLHWGQEVAVSSSNVSSARYHRDTLSLVITYLSGDTWVYDPVSPAEAEAFLLAPSKGRWLWDHVKVRGSRHAHQKNAARA
jgi:KTSC domain